MKQGKIFLAKVGDPHNRTGGPQPVEVFDSQSFYSQEYQGKFSEAVQAFESYKRLYDEWKKVYFLNSANNVTPPEFPQELRALVTTEIAADAPEKPAKKRNTKKSNTSRDEKRVRTDSSEESGGEGGSV